MNSKTSDFIAHALALSARQLDAYKLAKATRQAERDALAAAELRLADAEAAQTIIQKIAQQMQESAHSKIAGLVTRCLHAVYDEPYKFRIEFEQKRGKTEARFVFLDQQNNEIDPLTASGGGLVDIAAFALRLSAIMLSKPRVRRLMLLDEPFRFVSAKYRPALCSLLQQLEKELKVEIIMVTHIPELSIGNRIRL